jgi:hypothetical protein
MNECRIRIQGKQHDLAEPREGTLAKPSAGCPTSDEERPQLSKDAGKTWLPNPEKWETSPMAWAR